LFGHVLFDYSTLHHY